MAERGSAKRVAQSTTARAAAKKTAGQPVAAAAAKTPSQPPKGPAKAAAANGKKGAPRTVSSPVRSAPRAPRAPKAVPAGEPDIISVRGAREHNLRDIDV